MKSLNLKDYLNKPNTNWLTFDQPFWASSQVGSQVNTPIPTTAPLPNPQAPKQLDLNAGQAPATPSATPPVNNLSNPQQLVSGLTGQLASNVAAGNQNIKAQNDLLNGDNQAWHAAIEGQGQVLAQQVQSASRDLNTQYLRKSGELSLEDQQGQYNYSNRSDIKEKQAKLNAEFLDKGVRDPQQLAQLTGYDIGTVNKYLSGQLFSDLTASSNNVNQKAVDEQNTQAIRDLTAKKEIAQRNFQTSQEKLKATNDRQVQDATNNHNWSTASQQIVAAASGSGQTGWLINGLQAQNTQFDDVMSRVAKQFDRDNADMHNQYQDFMKNTETNMESINNWYKTSTASIKQQGMSNLISLQQNEVLGTEAYQKGINDLISNYTSWMNSVLNNVYTMKQQTIDNANKQSQMIFDQQYKQKEMAFDQNYKMSSLAMQQSNQQQDMQYKYDVLNQSKYSTPQLDPTTWQYVSMNNKTGEMKYLGTDQNSIQLVSSNNLEQVIQKCQSRVWSDKVQCWQLSNDYIKNATWQSGGIGDSYESKVKALSKLWLSQTPVVWWLFTFPVKWNNIWHVGIVTWINDDWSITVLEANREGKADGTVPKQGTYKSIWNFTFSQAPVSKSSTTNTAINDPNKPSGKNKLPAWDATSIWDLKAAINQTDWLTDIIEKYAGKMWPLQWRLSKLNTFDTDWQSANAEFNRITQIVWKSLEWWKLAEWDINRYLQMLPSITDKPDVAKNKLKSAKIYMQDILNQKLKSLWDSDYNVKNLYPTETTTTKSDSQSTTKTWWKTLKDIFWK